MDLISQYNFQYFQIGVEITNDFKILIFIYFIRYETIDARIFFTFIILGVGTVSNDKAAMRFFYAWFELSLYIFWRTQNLYHMTKQRRWKV